MKGGISMKKHMVVNRPEGPAYAVFTIHDRLDLSDVFAKLRAMISTEQENIWLNLQEITQTDFTATSVYIVNNFIKDHQGTFPRGKVIIVADTDLSYSIARTTLSLLRLDGFKGQAHLFRSRETALKWAELADVLH